MTTSFHINPRKIDLEWEDALRQIAHTLAENGIGFDDYEMGWDAYHTRRIEFQNDTHAMVFKLAFADWITSLEREEKEDQRKYEALSKLMAQQQIVATTQALNPYQQALQVTTNVLKPRLGR